MQGDVKTLYVCIQVSTCWSFKFYGTEMMKAMQNDKQLKGFSIQFEVVEGERSDKGGYGYVYAEFD